MVSVEVLGHCTVVHVRKLTTIGSIIEKQVFYVYYIYVSDLLEVLLVCALGNGILTSFGNLAVLRSLDREWVEIALLPLEAQTHIKVMEVIILLGVSIQRKTIWT